MDVDWHKSLVARHWDGREVNVYYVSQSGSFYNIQPALDGWYCFHKDGRNPMGWTIHNGRASDVDKAQPAAAKPSEIDAQLVERMVALVRRLSDNRYTGFDWHEDAIELVAELPEPVDADLLEARRMAKEMAVSTDHTWGKEPHCHKYDRGDFNDNQRAGVPLALAAIKRGRALEREKK